MRHTTSGFWRKGLCALTGVFFGFNSPAHPQSHPCTSTDPISGVLASGTPLSFKMDSSDQSYGVSGLAVFGHDFSRLAFRVGMAVSVSAESKNPDRYGRITGQVFITTADGSKQWLQGQLLTDGQALFSGSPSLPACRAAMISAEKASREKRAGIWAGDRSLEFNADDIEKLEAKAGHFVIVYGKVLSVGNRKTRLYLNFGQKWSQDFTALIAKRGKSAFKGNLDTLQNLKGKLVRVRGIVEKGGGPMIRVTSEAQIEIQ